MSVPNTSTFTLQDVYNEVHGHTPATTQDLSSCIANSVDGYFDASYKGSKNSLLNFRNYTVTASLPVCTLFNAPNGVTSSKIIIETNWTSVSTVTARGFWYNTTGYGLTGTQVVQTAATGLVTNNVTGLAANTTYYFTAYCTNSAGTTQVSFVGTITTAPSSVAWSSQYTTYTVPARVISITIECWGGGATGGSATGNPARAGGGSGGCYAKAVASVSPSQVLNIHAAAAVTGSTTAGLNGDYSSVETTTQTVLCKAMGGIKGADSTGTSSAGGTASSTGCVGTTIYIGGNGAAGVAGGASGGGGGCAGSTGVGNNASGATGGAAKTVNGGAGGTGQTIGGQYGEGGTYGGGGAGGITTSATDYRGGIGNQGRIIITFP